MVRLEGPKYFTILPNIEKLAQTANFWQQLYYSQISFSLRQTTIVDQNCDFYLQKNRMTCR